MVDQLIIVHQIFQANAIPAVIILRRRLFAKVRTVLGPAQACRLSEGEDNNSIGGLHES